MAGPGKDDAAFVRRDERLDFVRGGVDRLTKIFRRLIFSIDQPLKHTGRTSSSPPDRPRRNRSKDLLVLLTVGNHSLAAAAHRGQVFRRRPARAVLLLIIQMSVSSFWLLRSPDACLMKNNRWPSSVMNGSASENWPENGATSGVDHFPFCSWETTIVQ